MTMPDPETVDDEYLAFLSLSRDEFRRVIESQLALDRAAPRVGEPAPDIRANLVTSTGTEPIDVLFSGNRQKPTALIFGSFTCPPFRAAVAQTQEIARAVADTIDAYLVYVREAHPADGWQLELNRIDDVVFDQPRELVDRVAIAREMMQRLDVTLPVLIDELDDRAAIGYAALPSRLYLIDPSGLVVYRGGLGPWEFDIESWETAIATLAAECAAAPPPSTSD